MKAVLCSYGFNKIFSWLLKSNSGLEGYYFKLKFENKMRLPLKKSTTLTL